MRKSFQCLFFILCNISTFLYAGGMQGDIDRATLIVKEFETIPETGIPASILENAQGLAILSVVKGGFIFSGRVGEGIVIAKTSNGWSAPAAIGVGGAGFGFQIGASLTEFILVLNTKDAVDAFAQKGNVSLGADVSVAAGPVGRTAEGAFIPMAAVYSYSRSQGLFAGVSLEGTIILERSDANRDFYKQNVTPSELLNGKVPPPTSANDLYKELSKYTKPK
jgi:lipid-binding SYLF domain-containing protein